MMMAASKNGKKDFVNLAEELTKEPSNKQLAKEFLWDKNLSATMDDKAQILPDTKSVIQKALDNGWKPKTVKPTKMPHATDSILVIESFLKEKGYGNVAINNMTEKQMRSDADELGYNEWSGNSINHDKKTDPELQDLKDWSNKEGKYDPNTKIKIQSALENAGWEPPTVSDLHPWHDPDYTKKLYVKPNGKWEMFHNDGSGIKMDEGWGLHPLQHHLTPIEKPNYIVKKENTSGSPVYSVYKENADGDQLWTGAAFETPAQAQGYIDQKMAVEKPSPKPYVAGEGGPDMTGLTKKDVMEMAEKFGKDPEIAGKNWDAQQKRLASEPKRKEHAAEAKQWLHDSGILDEEIADEQGMTDADILKEAKEHGWEPGKPMLEESEEIYDSMGNRLDGGGSGE